MSGSECINEQSNGGVLQATKQSADVFFSRKNDPLLSNLSWPAEQHFISIGCEGNRCRNKLNQDEGFFLCIAMEDRLTPPRQNPITPIFNSSPQSQWAIDGLTLNSTPYKFKYRFVYFTSILIRVLQIFPSE